MKKERLNEIWGVLFLLLGLFTLASLIYFRHEDLPFYTTNPLLSAQNVTGMIGAYLAFGLFLTFGVSAYLIPALFLLWAGCFFLQKVPERKLFKFAGLGIALAATSTLVALFTPESARFQEAGAIGYLTGTHLLRYFGHLGGTILSISCLLLAMILATDFLIYPIFKNTIERFLAVVENVLGVFRHLGEWIEERFQKKERDTEKRIAAPKEVKQKKTEPLLKEAKASREIPKAPTLPPIPLKVKTYRPDLENNETALKEDDVKSVRAELEKMAAEKQKLPKIEKVPPPPAAPKAAAVEENAKLEVIGSSLSVAANYTFPPLDLLRKAPKNVLLAEDNLQANSKILEDTLAEFGIEVKVIEVEQGPVITRYELLPAPGVKVNSIAAVSDDIALALKATSVRLIIPIPGKSAVGVEVPNSVASIVFLRELIEAPSFRSKKAALPLALGKDTSGKPFVADLTAMPHLLIAGTTGSGKTVCVNSIITGFLYTCTPAELKLVMIDPKMVELAVYNKVPHMLLPVVTDVKKAAHTLNWVVTEMENRYKLFAKIGVRNIQSFNGRPVSEEGAAQVAAAGESENVVPARLPYIVVIIDELADLMMVAQDKVEGAITRLAQLSRAVGIHLILATQRPSVDVITGVIKANFPARISFKVASKVDSRTVLDTSGADKLIGKGDMLFMQPGDAKPTRGQASLIVDEEINGVVKFVSEQGAPVYHTEILAAHDGKGAAGGAGEKDELFDEAVAIVLETGQASTSNLQRRLRLGYTRAARIIDQMEAEGLVGPAQGAKPRDIYMGGRDERQPAQSEPVF